MAGSARELGITALVINFLMKDWRRLAAVVGVCIIGFGVVTGRVDPDAEARSPRQKTEAPIDHHHDLTPEQIAAKLTDLQQRWPAYVGGSAAYDREFIYGLVAVILLSGYKCDSVSSIAATTKSVGVWCNARAYRYSVSTRGGIPVARPIN